MTPALRETIPAAEIAAMQAAFPMRYLHRGGSLPQKFHVYLCGPITGLSFEDCSVYYNRIAELLPEWIVPVSPMRGKGYLQGIPVLGDTYEGTALASQRGIVSRDFFDVRRVDAVFANFLGAKRVSIGSVFELAWAFQLQKPVVLAMEDSVVESPLLSQLDAVWLAALIDGEGCVRVSRSKGKRTPWFQSDIRISMQCREIIERTAALTGLGTVRELPLHGNEKRHQWAWRVVGRQAETVLMAVYPGLIEKKVMAALVLEMGTATPKRYFNTPAKGSFGCRVKDPIVVAKQEEIYLRFRQAMARQPVAFVEPVLPQYTNIHEHAFVREACAFRLPTLEAAVETLVRVVTPGL